MKIRRLGLVGLLFLISCGEPAYPPPPVLPAAKSADKAAAPAPATAPAATTAPVKAAKKTGLLSDQWYSTTQDGQPSGWYHVRWTTSTFEGKPTIHDHTESFSSSTRQMSGLADNFQVASVSDLERTEEGMLLVQSQRTEQGERVSTAIQKWTGEGYELVSKVGNQAPDTHFVESDALCAVDAESFMSKKLQNDEVKVGARYEYKSPNYLGKRLDTVVLTVEAREKVETAAGDFDCFRLKQSVTGMPGDAKIWLDTSGVFRKQTDGRDMIVSTTEDEAREIPRGGAAFTITLPADPHMPRCTSIDKAIVDVTFEPREGQPLPDFPKTPFSRELSREGDVIRVELTAHDEEPLPGEPPKDDAQIKRALERTNTMCYDAPRVQTALKTALGGLKGTDEKTRAEQVKKLLHFSFTALRMGSPDNPTSGPSAEQILEDGCGVCAEHNTLFVTLCRGAGIPARRLSGYAQVGDSWGAHAFAEVWIGRWIGCDPTTNEFGTKARYIAFGWNDDPDSFPGLVTDRSIGRMSIRTVEFTEAGRTWKTDALGSGNGREQVLSGLAFAEPPAGWKVTIGALGRAKIKGPGVQADLTVVSGYGDLPCDILAGMMRGSGRGKFAGRDVLRDDMAVQGHVNVQLHIPHRRRYVSVRVRVDDPANVESAMKTLETMISPML